MYPDIVTVSEWARMLLTHAIAGGLRYTSRLASLQDDLDPMPASVVRAVVQQELLGGEPLESIFRDFEDTPLGSASIAQVRGNKTARAAA